MFFTILFLIFLPVLIFFALIGAGGNFSSRRYDYDDDDDDIRDIYKAPELVDLDDPKYERLREKYELFDPGWDDPENIPEILHESLMEEDPELFEEFYDEDYDDFND